MTEQLCLFDACSDTDQVSLQESRSDKKRAAIERYLKSGKKDPSICVNQYSPGGRAKKYYRLSYQIGDRKKHIHIKGGSVISTLATYRAGELQKLIDRGAELTEILSAVATFNGVSIADR